jgi:hypothetical protein
MTAIDDDLQELLADRAAAAPDNPERVVQVRARVRAGRRRRSIGTGLVLAAVVGGAVALTGAPGRQPDAPPGGEQPPGLVNTPDGAPIASPYFDQTGSEPIVRGYDMLGAARFSGIHTLKSVWFGDGRSYLIVVRCPGPGMLRAVGVDMIDGRHKASWEVDCRIPVGSEFEGALRLTASQGYTLIEGANLELQPQVPGRWSFALLVPGWPEYLPIESPRGASTLLDGRDSRDGGHFPARLNQLGDLTIDGQCVPGVTLSFRVGSQPIASVTCTGKTPSFSVGKAAVGRPGAQVRVDVTRTGAKTGQWVIYRLG